MSFDLLSIEVHRHAQSWVGLVGINDRHHLIYVEWNHDMHIENVHLLWFFDWYKKRVW